LTAKGEVYFFASLLSVRFPLRGEAEQSEWFTGATSWIVRAFLAAAPESEGKVFLLKSFGIAKCATDIYDPVGEALDVYRRVRDEIDAALPDLILYIMEKRT